MLKRTCLLSAIVFLLITAQTCAIADQSGAKETGAANAAAAPTPTSTPIPTNGVLKLTLKDAVDIGLKNSVLIKQVQNQIDLAALEKERADFKANEIKSGQKQMWSARKQLYEAQSALNAGYLPAEITAPVDILDQNGNVLFKKGQSIPKGTYIGGLPDALLNPIKSSIQDKLNKSFQTLAEAESSFNFQMSSASQNLSDKLDFSSMNSLDASQVSDLMTAMADTQFEVTSASNDIYKSQIALQIQKAYYDALLAQSELEVKKDAMERGKTQYEFAKAGYESGMKAKDDMLLAQIYYNSTILEYQKAYGDFENALTELKKCAGIPHAAQVQLTEVMADRPEAFNLNDGLTSAFQKRLEIKQALGTVTVYNINLAITAKTEDPKTFQYREAVMLLDKAKLALQKAYDDVEASVRQSYRNLLTASQMLSTVDDMVKAAKESLEIAEYKYKEGLPNDNSLLDKLNLKDASGTIVEVLAAEENLANIESKRVEIINSYNLARLKYLCDIGELTYIN